MKRKMGDYIFRSYFKRKFVNAVMCSALGFATVAMVVPLFLVFGYALFQGAPALNWSFFTELPKPVGELGGGMANALLGTTTVVATLLDLNTGTPVAVLDGAGFAARRTPMECAARPAPKRRSKSPG